MKRLYLCAVLLAIAAVLLSAVGCDEADRQSEREKPPTVAEPEKSKPRSDNDSSNTTPAEADNTYTGMLDYSPPGTVISDPCGYTLQTEKGFYYLGLDALNMGLKQFVGKRVRVTGKRSIRSFGGIEDPVRNYEHIEVTSIEEIKTEEMFTGTIDFMPPTDAIGGESDPCGFVLRTEKGVYYLEGDISGMGIVQFLGKRVQLKGKRTIRSFGGVETPLRSFEFIEITSIREIEMPKPDPKDFSEAGLIQIEGTYTGQIGYRSTPWGCGLSGYVLQTEKEVYYLNNAIPIMELLGKYVEITGMQDIIFVGGVETPRRSFRILKVMSIRELERPDGLE